MNAATENEFEVSPRDVCRPKPSQHCSGTQCQEARSQLVNVRMSDPFDQIRVLQILQRPRHQEKPTQRPSLARPDHQFRKYGTSLIRPTDTQKQDIQLFWNPTFYILSNMWKQGRLKQLTATPGRWLVLARMAAVTSCKSNRVRPHEGHET